MLTAFIGVIKMSYRLGLVRAREFMMKDLYSFDVSRANAMVTYEEVCRAYFRVFERFGAWCE